MSIALFAGIVAFSAAAEPQALTARDLDRMLEAEWRSHKVTPASPIDDAAFLRRLYLDLLGTIPPPEAVLAFLAEKGPDKRARAVEALVETRRFTEHWTDYWDKTLLGRDVKDPAVDREAFRNWLRAELEKNTPYDNIVRKLIAGTGKNSQVKPSAPLTPQQKPFEATPVNAAVNWLVRYQPNPPDLAGKVARIFLGVQIQCAECHDHPYEKWTQEDFRKLAACFAQTRVVALGDGKPVMGVKPVVLLEADRPQFGGPNQELAAIAKAKPAALDGTDLSSKKNRRAALADWLTAKTNPRLARATVNRLWAHFLGRGFFDPVDDLRSSGTIDAPAILDRLTQDFIDGGYDLRRLIRLIASTRAYQLAAGSARGKDVLLWSRHPLRPLGPDDLLEALVRATNLESVMWMVSGGNFDRFRAQMKSGLGFVFDIDETLEHVEFEGTVPQMLLLMNGSLVTHATGLIPGTALEDVLALPAGDEAKIEALYLRALSRKPSSDELKAWLAFLNAPREMEAEAQPAKGPAATNQGRIGYLPDPVERAPYKLKTRARTAKAQAYEDLFWSLLNTSEFFFRH